MIGQVFGPRRHRACFAATILCMCSRARIFNSCINKINILENLFRIDCVDQDLDHEEHEMIRKISGLLQIDHKDFIDTKIRIKKEFGLDTAGL